MTLTDKDTIPTCPTYITYLPTWHTYLPTWITYLPIWLPTWPTYLTYLPCDIRDTDNNSNNRELHFMTIFVTRQLRVTVDSICNSCDLFKKQGVYHIKFDILGWMIRTRTFKDFKDFKDFQRRSRTLKDFQRLPRIFKDFQRLPRTLKVFQGLWRTSKDFQKRRIQ